MMITRLRVNRIRAANCSAHLELWIALAMTKPNAEKVLATIEEVIGCKSATGNISDRDCGPKIDNSMQ